MTRKNQGFTLIELMIVIAIIAIIAAIAVPNLLSARLSANESTAISTLRNLVSAQAQFQSSANMDDNSNGSGEYGSFAELSGKCNLNLRAATAGAATPLTPPMLPATFQSISAQGFCSKSGYSFVIFLPDINSAGVKDKASGAGPGTGVDATNCEVMWCAYAWPINAGNTGNRAFFVNQRGEILQTRMAGYQYTGVTTRAPAFDGAFVAPTGKMTSALAVGVNGNDTNAWVPLG